MYIAFTGGRDYQDRAAVEGVLSAIAHSYTAIRVGDATGLDALVRRACVEWKLSHQIFRADWDKYGKAAGPIRNRELLQGSHLLIAFPGGRGTENCVKQARELGILTLVVTP